MQRFSSFFIRFSGRGPRPGEASRVLRGRGCSYSSVKRFLVLANRAQATLAPAPAKAVVDLSSAPAAPAVVLAEVVVAPGQGVAREDKQVLEPLVALLGRVD